jgi:hypothetical protein
VIPTGDHRLRRHTVLVVALLLWLSPADLLAQTTKLRVAICARTISMGVGSPFAVAMKMGWFSQEKFPQTKPTGKDEATAVREESSRPACPTTRWNVITQRVPTGDLITNEMIDEINRMDPAKIAAEAAVYRYRR